MFDAKRITMNSRRAGFTLIQLAIVVAIVAVMAFTPLGHPSGWSTRNYPIHQIGMLFLAVGCLAALARQAIVQGRRGDCVYLLSAACFVCVASMVGTVVKHYERPEPIKCERLTDLTHAHRCPTCKSVEVVR